MEKAGFVFDIVALKKRKIDCVKVRPNKPVVQQEEVGQQEEAPDEVSCSPVDEDAGRSEEDPSLSLVTSSTAIVDSDPDQDAVLEEEATPDAYLPPGWTHIKLEPDC